MDRTRDRPLGGIVRRWAAAVLVGVLALGLGPMVRPAAAAPITDPGAAGDCFLNVGLNTNNLSGPYQIGYAITCPSGMYPAPESMAATAILCSAPDGAGSCGSRTSLGALADEEQVGDGTESNHGHNTETGGWCGSQCYVDPAQFQIGSSGTTGQVYIDGTGFTASEDVDYFVGGASTNPTDWHPDWYTSTGEPPPHEDPVLVETANGGTVNPTTWEIQHASASQDVTCVVGDGFSVADPDEYTGTTDGDGVFEFSHTFSDSGVFNVECEPDTGTFPGGATSVFTVTNIGIGLGDIFSESCGSTDFFCHVRKALVSVIVPEDLTGSLSDLRDEAEGSFPFSLVVDVYTAFDVLSADLPASARPSISIPLDPLGDGGGTFTITAPDLSSESATNASSVCSWSGSETDACETYAAINDDGGVFELWGFRTAIRTTLSIGLYFSFFWWAIRWWQGRRDGGEAGA